jgi:crotonobetainyl-CoA:carnitine CoA-transferase CaiB-like acyl-CoA transferase
MFHILEHPTAGDVKLLSPPVRLDEVGFAPAPPTAAFGSETESLLLELGFSQTQIDKLVDGNVTHKS